MAKPNKFKRIRKIANVAEHNRKYALQQDANKCPEVVAHKVTDLVGGSGILLPESPPKPANPTLGQLFSFASPHYDREGNSSEPVQG